MISFQKINELVVNLQFEQLLSYIDTIIQEQSQTQMKEHLWVIDYKDQKRKINQTLTDIIEHQYNSSSQNSQQLIAIQQQSILKLFSKGFILPQLNYLKDIDILKKVLDHSQNTKYLFMIFQENIYQLKELYQHNFPDYCDHIMLKFLSLSSCFIKLVWKPLFQDVQSKYKEFYSIFHKLMNQHNLVQQPKQQQTQIINISNNFFNQTINKFYLIISTQSNKQPYVQQSNKKINQRKVIFYFLNLLNANLLNLNLLNRNPFNLNLLDAHISQNSTKIQQLNEITRKFVNLTQTKMDEINILPSFWISNQIQNIQLFYARQYIFVLFSNILIQELPSKPQYTKLSKHLFILIKYVCEYIYLLKQPITTLSTNQNPQFLINLFERLSILVGILNKQKNDQKQIDFMINAIFNKKSLFINPKMPQIVWRKLIQKQSDTNFINFCIGQYKKVFSYSCKELQTTNIPILREGFFLVLKLITKLQGNSDPQHIGFYITLVIYYLACLRKITKYYCKEATDINFEKQEKIFKFYFSDKIQYNMKQNIKYILFKLKQSLKDRLQVMKMKISQKNNQQNLSKQGNQISICMYRIQEQIKFD